MVELVVKISFILVKFAFHKYVTACWSFKRTPDPLGRPAQYRYPLLFNNSGHLKKKWLLKFLNDTILFIMVELVVKISFILVKFAFHKYVTACWSFKRAPDPLGRPKKKTGRHHPAAHYCGTGYSACCAVPLSNCFVYWCITDGCFCSTSTDDPVLTFFRLLRDTEQHPGLHAVDNVPEFHPLLIPRINGVHLCVRSCKFKLHATILSF